MAVIGLMLVTSVIALTVAGVTLNAIGQTTSTRAYVQSQAAADSGIDVAVAAMTAGTCAPSLSRTAVPAFTVTVMYSLSDSGESWTDGCPGGAPAKRVKISSTGAAVSVGAAGNSTGNSRSVEAVYALPPANVTVVPSGDAVYGYGGANLGSNFAFVNTSGSRPRVVSKAGTVTCQSNSGLVADIVVPSGSLTMDGNCVVKGDAWSSGPVTLTLNARIDGSLVASSIDLSGNAIVGGNAWSSGPVRVSANGIIGGAVNAPSVVTSESGRFGGRSSAPAPPTPQVAPWVDFAYQPSDWKDPDGRIFKETVLAAGNCQLTQATLQAAAEGARSVIVNAQNCSSLTVSGNTDLTLLSDVVVVAKAFEFSGNTRLLASANRKLWFITPDPATAGPTCQPGGKFTVDGNFSTQSTVSAMVYSPCKLVTSANTAWRGQAYVGTTDMGANTVLTYVPMGLPGKNLTDGTSTSGTPVAGLAARLSIRDVGAG
jgi:cytoskeletal protein CcmA (bactofilin family)